MFRRIALVGNPNCGKTTIFNALTGAHQYVGNWPGVTVEKKSGYFERNGKTVEVVDLPGVYSLSVIAEASEDERVARDFLIFEKPDCAVNVIDASNLERNLYMTLQLAEMHIPVIVVLNMMDAAADNKMKIDVLGLAQALNVPVIPMIASRSKGMEELKDQIVRSELKADESFVIPYCAPIENAVREILPRVEGRAKALGRPPRWLAVHLLDGDGDPRFFETAEDAERVRAVKDAFAAEYGEDSDTLIADGRYELIGELSKRLITHAGRVSQTVTEMIDRVALGKWTGIPCFMLMMYLMFVWTITGGDLLIDPISEWGDKYLVYGFASLLEAGHAPDWLVALLAEGAGRGISTVATFIPPIGLLFLFLSFLEDSGYMARGAFVMDKLMRWFGLPGTAFVPMIVAFGCTVPAVMGTRTLSSFRDRLVTLVMTPFMSCGARLPVYALFAAAFFPENGGNVVFLLYLTGIAAAVASGLIMKSTVLKGKAVPLILEMPPYHLPTLKNIALRTWERLKGFIIRAGTLIIPLVVVLNVLNTVDFRGRYIPETPQDSVLSSVGKAVVPVFEPLGISEENWPAAVGLMTGVMAKEAVIGTLDALYGALSPATDPSTRLTTFFDGKIGAFAYLLFVLTYMPCFAAMGAILKEFGWKWVGFTALWTTGQAFALSTLFYQSATINRHPEASVRIIALILLLEAFVYAGLYVFGKRRRHDPV